MNHVSTCIAAHEPPDCCLSDLCLQLATASGLQGYGLQVGSCFLHFAPMFRSRFLVLTGNADHHLQVAILYSTVAGRKQSIM